MARPLLAFAAATLVMAGGAQAQAPAAPAPARPAAPAAPPAPAAPAATPPDPAAIQAEAEAAIRAYVKAPEYRKLLADAFARVPASIVHRCPKLGFSDVFVIPTSPLRFAPDRTLVGGSWRDGQVARGCGPDIQLNYFFFATPQRRTLIVVGAPGTSRADLPQQRDARTYALVALDPLAAGCQSFEVVNTRFERWGSRNGELADPGEKAPFRPWWESWVLLGCGKRWAVPLEFRPNSLGTQIIQPGGVAEERGS